VRAQDRRRAAFGSYEFRFRDAGIGEGGCAWGQRQNEADFYSFISSPQAKVDMKFEKLLLFRPSRSFYLLRPSRAILFLRKLLFLLLDATAARFEEVARSGLFFFIGFLFCYPFRHQADKTRL